MNGLTLTEAQVRQFGEDGYLLIKGLFDTEEMDLLRNIGRADEELAKNTASRRDAQGGVTTLSLSNDLAEDIYSAFVRCHRIVDPMEQLLVGEVYHYHHKMNMKAPYVGGAWEWHQDYGYWYNNGCLLPDMASCFIAVDRATKENGCLQVIKGSHKMGRIDHGKVADQTGADMERVNAALERMELVHCEMEPGDALFFHSNLLHRSDQNRSPDPRWVLICCYNTKANDPYKQSHHRSYSYLEKWDDSRIKEIGRKQWEEMKG
jgi:ectoine hydroxylase-related dioxygenase (phytanoyl-CoA dioxygenase family)